MIRGSSIASKDLYRARLIRPGVFCIDVTFLLISAVSFALISNPVRRLCRTLPKRLEV